MKIKPGRIFCSFVMFTLALTIKAPIAQAEIQDAGTTELVSAASDGAQGNDSSFNPSISADGRFVAFESTARNLAPVNSIILNNIFVRDRQTGAIEIASVAPDGTLGNDASYNPTISADGRYVAFVSESSNLVAGDTNGETDVFVYDRQTGITQLVSVTSDGPRGNAYRESPSISADGRYVAFSCWSGSQVPGNIKGMNEVFVRDRQTGVTERVSVTSDGVQGNCWSINPSISADGRYVAFASCSSNLAAGDKNEEFDIFVHDRQTGATELVSAASDGTWGDNRSLSPSISADGRYVVFASIADNLVTGDTNKEVDVFVHDRQTGVTRLVSVTQDGTQGNSSSSFPLISANGRYVAFVSEASNLIPGDINGNYDIFVHDQQTGAIQIVSVASDGTRGNDASRALSISADGRFMAFESSASNLVSGDTNNRSDIFVHDREGIWGQDALRGRVTTLDGTGIPGVTISVGGAVLPVTTDSEGRYSISAPLGRTYAITPTLTGYIFTPGSLTVNLSQNRTNQNFTGSAVTCTPSAAGTSDRLECFSPASDPFLFPPVPYQGDVSNFLQDTDIKGGYISSWFDHDQPTNHGNGHVTLYNGNVYNNLTTATLPGGVYCYDRLCYDGHDDMDIIQRSNTAREIYPAATGAVLETCHRDKNLFPNESCSRDINLGRYVVIGHRNNTYATLYAHLASISDQVTPGAIVMRNDHQSPAPIGIMGGSGGSPLQENKWPAHLHFQVFINRFSSRPWTPSQNEVVDPMGWQPANGNSDPWGAAPSAPLFKNTEPASCSPGSVGETLSIGSVTAQIPGGAVSDGQVVSMTFNPPSSDLLGSLREIGRSFYLRVSGLSGSQDASIGQAQLAVSDFSQPVAINVDYSSAGMAHLDKSLLSLYLKDPAGGNWNKIPGMIDSGTQTLSAFVSQPGDYALQAPLICPADGAEPWDDSPSLKGSLPVLTQSSSLPRIFDLPADEDWLSITAIPGVTYTFHTEDLAAGVDTQLTLFAPDQQTIISSDDNGGGGASSLITWTADSAGVYFLRVSQAQGSASGCDSSYQVRVSSDMHIIYLPAVTK